MFYYVLFENMLDHLLQFIPKSISNLNSVTVQVCLAQTEKQPLLGNALEFDYVLINQNSIYQQHTVLHLAEPK